MTYANQHAYDNATEPDISDYRDSVMFGEFCEYVTLNLLRGVDYEGIDADIFMGDLHEAGGGYRMAYEWVAERLTEEQFKEWLDD